MALSDGRLNITMTSPFTLMVQEIAKLGQINCVRSVLIHFTKLSQLASLWARLPKPCWAGAWFPVPKMPRSKINRKMWHDFAAQCGSSSWVSLTHATLTREIHAQNESNESVFRLLLRLLAISRDKVEDEKASTTVWRRKRHATEAEDGQSLLPAPVKVWHECSGVVTDQSPALSKTNRANYLSSTVTAIYCAVILVYLCSLHLWGAFQDSREVPVVLNKISKKTRPLKTLHIRL